MKGYTHREVVRIAAPLILSNITVPLLGIVDTAVVGHLEHAFYMGAVAIGATIFSFVFMGFNFLRMGTTGVAAQAHGSGDYDEMRNILAQALLTAAGLGLVMIFFQKPVFELSIWLLQPSSDVAIHAGRYFDIRIWAAPAALANFAMVGWFIGMQNARGPLILLLVINVSNIILDLLFVVGLNMRTEGVALASLIAEYSGIATGLWLVSRELRDKPGHFKIARILDTHSLRRYFSINANLLIRTFSLMFAFAFLTAQGARQGELILAANAVLLNLQYFVAYGLDGFANAAEALVGKAIGQKNRDGLGRAISLSLFWSMLLAGFFSLLYLFAGHQIVYAITDITAVADTIFDYLPWLIVLPLVSFWSFLFDGIFVGATRAKEMRNTMLFSAFAIYVPAFYMFRFMGNHGLWLAFALFMAARGLSMFIVWRRLMAQNLILPAQ